MSPYRNAILLMTFLTMLPHTAAAQDRFDVQQFNPVPAQQVNHFSVVSARVLEHGDWEAGFVLHYADDPLVLLSEEDERVVSIVSGLMTSNFLGAVGLFDWLEVGADIPLILLQDGDDASQIEYTSVGGFSIGDIRLIPRFLLFTQETGEQTGGFSVGLSAAFYLPTGDERAFQGEGFRCEPRLAVDYAFFNRFRASINLGYLVRSDTRFVNVEVNDTLTYGAALSVALSPQLFLVPEVAGKASVLVDEIDPEELPLEALLGAKFYPLEGLLLEGGAGMGLVEGFGSPDWRVFFGLSYSPPAVRDSDGDGYFDEVDTCPLDPEDFDGYQDEDGCSDPDNDMDTIPDIRDSCPLEPEDLDDFEDADGCPDPDNDSDGILDVVDHCPLQAEQFDQWQDEDGCPDPDNDGDGLMDSQDTCPNEPESVNGYQDQDGCPDSPPLIEETPCQRIGLRDKVYFDTDSDRIQERSYELLDQVANILIARPDIRLVRVEGHTDDRGSDRHNLDLSQRRAESVRVYLIERGVEPGQLLAVGYGETQPIDDNGTREGRAENRRVEFIILVQDGCANIVPPY